ATHTDRHETVTDDQGQMITLRTSAGSGEPRVIVLAVRRDTYQIVRELLVFGDSSRLELELLDGSSSTSALITRRVPEPTKPTREELERAELQARLILGQSGLDMRGHVNVSLDQVSVIVDGAISTTASERRVARAPSPRSHMSRLRYVVESSAASERMA